MEKVLLPRGLITGEKRLMCFHPPPPSPLLPYKGEADIMDITFGHDEALIRFQ